MFEFHGWVNIKADDKDDPDISEYDRRLLKLYSVTEEKLKQVIWDNGHFKLFYGVNGEVHLLCTGFANHRHQEVIDFFSWIAQTQNSSYGLLHVWDDEDNTRNNQNNFLVYVIKKGTMTEKVEALLSPCITTIEEQTT